MRNTMQAREFRRNERAQLGDNAPIAEPRRGPLMITSYGLDNDWHVTPPQKKRPSHQSKISFTKIPTKPPHTQEQKGDLHNHRKSKNAESSCYTVSK